MSRWQKVKQRLRDLYNRQPEIISVRPLNFSNPPKKFSMEGVIIESDGRVRTFTKGGSSIHITIPTHWQEHLKPPFRLHLFQTDKRGILIEQVEI